MTSGMLYFDADIESDASDFNDEEWEVMSDSDGNLMAASENKFAAGLYVYEGSQRVQMQWYGTDHVDLGELNFAFTQLRRMLPDSVEVNELNEVRFKVLDSLQFEYTGDKTANETGVVEICENGYTISALTTDEDSVLELNTVQTEVDSLDSVRDTYYEVADYIGDRFDFNRVL